MILYDWKQVLKHSEKSSKRIVSIIRYLTYKPIPRSRFDEAYVYSSINWQGKSFLLNPELLLYNGYKHSSRDMAYYIGLASLRNLAQYQATNKLSLDLLACIGKEDAINNNSLLTIEDDQVHFLYEVAT